MSDKLRELVVGIDAGLETGIGIFDPQTQKLFAVHTTDFFGAEEYLNVLTRTARLRIFLEVPPAFVYARNAGQSGAVRDKHAINIGGNRREAQLLSKLLKRAGFDVTEVPPVRQLKWTADQFKRHLQTDLRSNQHERDAARLAYVNAGRRK
ncbi:MAG TPA: hypothetical protein VNI84_19605 [Pyrinomonadaceae bacterium]|nr:hypothetical protein [Pyrinomonadaceae bacterium]